MKATTDICAGAPARPNFNSTVRHLGTRNARESHDTKPIKALSFKTHRSTPDCVAHVPGNVAPINRKGHCAGHLHRPTSTQTHTAAARVRHERRTGDTRNQTNQGCVLYNSPRHVTYGCSTTTMTHDQLVFSHTWSRSHRLFSRSARHVEATTWR